MIVFDVPGAPVPQGSMKAFVVNGTARVTHNKSGPLLDYRTRIAMAAKEAGAESDDSPWHIEITFRLPRPKAHYGTGRNANLIKPAAPRYPTSKPDIDKMVRSVLDALTGIAYRDDSQVVVLQTFKQYGEPGTRVVMRNLNAEISPDAVRIEK